MTKIYKTIGLEYYITDCRDKVHALVSFLHYRIGVTPQNIEEFQGEISDIPENANIMSAI